MIASVVAAGATTMLVATGSSVVTVTVAPAEMVPAVAVTIAVPAARAVKSPLASMVPTVALPLSQATSTPVMTLPNWSRTVASNATVLLTVTVGVSGVMVISVATGPPGSPAFTVTVAVPDTLPAVAVTVALPAAFAVKRPVSSMVPTVALSLVQVNVTPDSLSPNWSRASAENGSVSPTFRVAVGGVTSMFVTTRSTGASGW
ncbi:hypothetical protein DSECCO2_576170 [anaerobic digester metagenome]